MQAKQTYSNESDVYIISKAFFEHFQQLTLKLCEFFRDVSCYGIYSFNEFIPWFPDTLLCFFI